MLYPDSYQVDGAGRISLGGIRIAELAERFGTPLYLLDYATLVHRVDAYKNALNRMDPPGTAYYAGKAFLCRAMAGFLAERGLGLDVVSGGELATALAGGFDPARILLHGNVKTPEELEYALSVGVGLIVVDSIDELRLVDGLAGTMGKTAAILLRLTPGIEAHTHAFIQTGQFDSKFGFGMADGIADRAMEEALERKHVRVIGLHAHIGSQILESDPFLANAEILFRFSQQWHHRNGWWPQVLDIGGGVGVHYGPDDTPPELDDLVNRLSMIQSEWTPKGCAKPRLLLEPGRSIVGEAGMTLYRVGAVKTVPGGKCYVSLDGGMGDNIRPALYQAPYVAVVDGASGNRTMEATLAGRYCESGDILIDRARLPASIRAGDLVAVLVTGAYNYSMASNYNRVPRPGVVLVSNGQAREWVRRETWEDVAALDEPWQAVDPEGFI